MRKCLHFIQKLTRVQSNKGPQGYHFWGNYKQYIRLVMIPSAGTVADTETTFQKENLLVTDNLSLVYGILSIIKEPLIQICYQILNVFKSFLKNFLWELEEVTWALKMAQKGVVVDGYSADLRLNGDV